MLSLTIGFLLGVLTGVLYGPVINVSSHLSRKLLPDMRASSLLPTRTWIRRQLLVREFASSLIEAIAVCALIGGPLLTATSLMPHHSAFQLAWLVGFMISALLVPVRRDAA